jgi:hypothetical protein
LVIKTNRGRWAGADPCESGCLVPEQESANKAHTTSNPCLQKLMKGSFVRQFRSSYNEERVMNDWRTKAVVYRHRQRGATRFSGRCRRVIISTELESGFKSGARATGLGGSSQVLQQSRQVLSGTIRRLKFCRCAGDRLTSLLPRQGLILLRSSRSLLCFLILRVSCSQLPIQETHLVGEFFDALADGCCATHVAGFCVVVQQHRPV